jgi:hypothetical protein
LAQVTKASAAASFRAATATTSASARSSYDDDNGDMPWYAMKNGGIYHEYHELPNLKNLVSSSHHGDMA